MYLSIRVCTYVRTYTNINVCMYVGVYLREFENQITRNFTDFTDTR